MIFINHQKSAKAAKDYYTQHIAPGDGRYYTEENAAQMKGVWHGRGAEMLQLSGEVNQEDFFRLCDNINPLTGERLTARTDDDRRVMTDITFDVPKSVTLAYDLGGDDRILEVFQRSARETMSEIEDDSQTRVRRMEFRPYIYDPTGKEYAKWVRDNKEIKELRGLKFRWNAETRYLETLEKVDYNRPSGNMIWAEHIHKTARPVTKEDKQTVDPQLHMHATVFNATFDPEEKRWKAIQLGDIVRDKGYYQAAFHARLASNLKGLGYGIEKDGNSFRLAGITKETTDKFSRRSKVIDKEAERLGIDDAASKSKLGRRTREKKSEQPQAMEELQTEWFMRLSNAERELFRTLNPYQRTHDERVPEKAPGNAGDAPITPEEAKQYAIEHSFQNASAVSEKRLKAEALTHAVGSVRPEDVADIAQHPEAIPVKHDGQLFVTTKTVLNNEVAMLQFAKDGQRKQKPFLASRQVLEANLTESTYEASSNPFGNGFAGLSDEQKKAMLHILNSRDTVTGLVGKAGTGKTTLMRVTRDALESEPGQHVFAFAPSSQASRGVLANEGFKDATTLATLLKSAKMQEQVKGQIIWVDEAGQVSSNDMKRLMDVVKKGNNRLILSGDYTQHSSVEAGDAFRLLEKEAGVRLARLTEIRRQTEPGYKKAVEAIAQGTGKAAQKGFDVLDKMGSVIEATGEERHKLLVADYLKAQQERKSALIVSPTNAEARRLTEELRATLKQNGAIGEERPFTVRSAMKWSDAQKGDVRNYETGMVIDFHQAVAGVRVRKAGKRVTEGGFEKGEAAVVSAIASDSVSLTRQDGTTATLPLAMKERFQVSRARDISVGRGDRIRITKNGEAKVECQTTGTRVNNGDTFTVEGFTKEGDIRLEKGNLLPKNWGHFDLGYVDTSYKSQGKTVDRVFIATGRESLAATNQQQWYVSASRGREMAKIYVEDKQDVRDAIARTGQRLSAVELTRTKLRPSWRHRFHESLERNRVGRFLKARAVAIGDYWRGRESVNYA